MWSIDENLVNDFSNFLPPTITNIFYIDQQLGVWLYNQLNHMRNSKEYANALKDKIDNFFVGIAEIVVSTGLPMVLLQKKESIAAEATNTGRCNNMYILFDCACV